MATSAGQDDGDDPVVLMIALVIIIAVAAGLFFGYKALTGQGEGDDAERRTQALCKKVDGTLSFNPKYGGDCEAQTAPDTIETIELTDQGRPDDEDMVDRKGRCLSAERESKQSARSDSEQEPQTSRETSVWVSAPGFCRTRTVRFSTADRRRYRRIYLMTKARLAVGYGDPATGRRYAQRAQAIEKDRSSTVLIRRATSKIRSNAAAARSQATQQVSPNEYLGLNCDEIGHSFSVVPGSDPAHDRNNDGQACESQ